ncbi:hypothetical protein BpHYR1_013933 [Brachionus plicatilis]|uniref:Uncharacterized protein n=1 Tax=Brachionus plicatilis TaxID=10195 RepID=A0A3M7QCX6_BRAPC|nr:hypothetical protein BpHYR1_013933 [Brachionus plicatilis]
MSELLILELLFPFYNRFIIFVAKNKKIFDLYKKPFVVLKNYINNHSGFKGLRPVYPTGFSKFVHSSKYLLKNIDYGKSYSEILQKFLLNENLN